MDFLTDYFMQRFFEHINDVTILEGKEIPRENGYQFENIVKQYLITNNQTNWGFGDRVTDDGKLINLELETYFIEITTEFAVMNHNNINIYGLNDDGSESLIEFVSQFNDFDRFIIER